MRTLLWSSLLAGSCAVNLALYIRMRGEAESARGAEETALGLQRFCEVTRATLESHADVLASTAPADQNLKAPLLARFGGDRVGDGAMFLENCLSEPFDFDHYRDCMARDDLSCVATMWRSAAKAVRKAH